MARYFEEVNVEALFATGACRFRMDPAASGVITETLRGAEWHMPILPDDISRPAYLPEKPVAHLTEVEKAKISASLQDVLRDEVLMRPFQGFGDLEVNQVEAFNGAIDEDWHHDGLAGKRGHAGDFFLLCYFSLSDLSDWDPEWGGSFDIGERSLEENWVHEVAEPDRYLSIFPKPRTCVLGWNGNPRLVHRSAPLKAKVDRIVVAASLRFYPAAAR